MPSPFSVTSPYSYIPHLHARFAHLTPRYLTSNLISLDIHLLKTSLGNHLLNDLDLVALHEPVPFAKGNTAFGALLDFHGRLLSLLEGINRSYMSNIVSFVRSQEGSHVWRVEGKTNPYKSPHHSATPERSNSSQSLHCASYTPQRFCKLSP